MPKHYRPAGKKKEGNAAKYVTRSQALKVLQAPLSIFRKICILKGIVPRDPKKKVKGNHQTYYHTKDIAHIQHDPILGKIREIRSHSRKIKKALSKKNKARADILKEKMPAYNIHGNIRHRYPRFVDALGDLDDCLTMVHLFAALPTLDNQKISVERIHNCRRLSHEWQAYVARTHKLRKTFISVKGIYYQAEVEGQKITWIVPHSLQQVVPADVDLNVFSTFLEIYETLLAFVNYKLYHSINVKYPPILDPRLEALAAELYALSRYIASRPTSNSMEELDNHTEARQIDEPQLTLAQLKHQLTPAEPGALMQLVEETEIVDDVDDETRECRSLFKGLSFFLSREVPREPLLFVISSFGGMVSWEGDGSPLKESDQSITHQIVDRPSQDHMFLSREYIQPQWIFDSVNARIILPTDDYLVGRVLPPHLSPFVDNDAEGYVPDYAQKVKELQAAAKKQVLPLPAVGDDDVDDTQNLLLEGVASRVEAKEAIEKKQKMAKLEKQYHEELEKELRGIHNDAGTEKPSSAENTAVSDMEKEQQISKDQGVEDATEMDEMMMTRKNRGLYKAMQISNQRKQDRIDKLKSRKRKIQERGSSSSKK
ncbi:pescadillo homolog [Silene latifolia]|uniref:pescadillo homolog n=1 Tax=Silene latifolia TaxID=37657 RepID=UPI003D786A82